MKQNYLIISKGEYVSPSCSCIDVEPAAVLCMSGEIDGLEKITYTDPWAL